MKKVKIEIPDGFELVQIGEGKWEQRKEKTPPKTWEEFCKSHPIKEDEYYLDPGVGIAAFGKLSEPFKSRTTYNRDILPNKETAEAILALMQLIQLRNCYNGSWVPDWEDAEEKKHVILSNGNEIAGFIGDLLSFPLAFKSEGLRDQFLGNFRDLIEIAKPLI